MVLAYHAFISYSHEGERGLARSLQLALEALARPLFRQRSMRVFRDEANLAANPDLWASIESAIDSSRVLVLLASPKAARSVWIPREVARFVTQRGRESVCIALASGVTPWTRDEPPMEVLAREDSAVSPEVYQLLSVPERLPLVVDFSPFAGLTHEERLASGDFQSRIATVAALILGRDKDSIYNEHIARQRRVIRLAGVAVCVLVGAAGFAGWQAILAQRARGEAVTERNVALSARDSAEQARRFADAQRARADTQRAIADSQRVRAVSAEGRALAERDAARRQATANGAYALAERDPTVALQLARVSATADTNSATAAALVRAFNTGSWFYSHRFDGAWDGDISADGGQLAVLDGHGAMQVLSPVSGRTMSIATKASSVRILPNGNLVLWSGWHGVGTKGVVELLTPHGRVVAHHEFESLNVLVCPSGEIFVPAFARERTVVAQVINPGTGAVRSLVLPEKIKNIGGPAACLPGRGGIALVQAVPGALALVGLDGRARLLDIPREYHAVDVAVDEQRDRVAVYLSGAIRGVSDAIGWLPVEAALRSGADLRITPLPMSPSFDSGGRICFLSSGRVLAASTDGWTRVLDLDRGDTTVFVPRSRAVDAIALSPAGDVVVLARRSGATTAYTPDGTPVAQLLGELYSDGLNPAVDRLVFDRSGQMLLMVASSTVLLWRHPSFALTVPHDSAFRRFDHLPARVLSAIHTALPGRPGRGFVACRGPRGYRLDDAGAITLCVTGFGRTEFLGVGLFKAEFELVGSGSIEGIGHRLISESADRVYALSPSQILRFVDAENRHGRLWVPDSVTVASWIAPSGGSQR